MSGEACPPRSEDTGADCSGAAKRCQMAFGAMVSDYFFGEFPSSKGSPQPRILESRDMGTIVLSREHGAPKDGR